MTLESIQLRICGCTDVVRGVRALRWSILVNCDRKKQKQNRNNEIIKIFENHRMSDLQKKVSFLSRPKGSSRITNNGNFKAKLLITDSKRVHAPPYLTRESKTAWSSESSNKSAQIKCVCLLRCVSTCEETSIENLFLWQACINY